MFKNKHLFSLFLLFVGNISNAFCANYTTSSIINSGGGISSSSNYSAHYSLGHLAGENMSSASYQIQTDILSIPDTDKDGILDNIDNCLLLGNVNQVNNDEDTLGDACDLDDDNDGLSDIAEASLGTNPILSDTDADGLSDGVDPDPLTPNADGDLAPYGSPDGIINAADLFIAQQIVLGVITPTTQDIIHADLYPVGAPDGVINISDLILFEKLILSPAF